MTSCTYSSIININEVRRDGGYWVITSENLAGLLLCGKDLKKLRADIPAAIKLLFKMNFDLEVNVCPVTEPSQIAKTPTRKGIANSDIWTALPVQSAACA